MRCRPLLGRIRARFFEQHHLDAALQEPAHGTETDSQASIGAPSSPGKRERVPALGTVRAERFRTIFHLSQYHVMTGGIY